MGPPQRSQNLGVQPECPGQELDLDDVLTEAGVDLRNVGRFVMIEATLQSIDRLYRPILNSFVLRYSCDDLFG